MSDQDQNCHPVPASRELHFNEISTQLGFLEGKVLTLVDATFGDREQRKAFKDMVRAQFRAQKTHIESICFGIGAYLEQSTENPGRELLK